MFRSTIISLLLLILVVSHSLASSEPEAYQEEQERISKVWLDRLPDSSFFVVHQEAYSDGNFSNLTVFELFDKNLDLLWSKQWILTEQVL